MISKTFEQLLTPNEIDAWHWIRRAWVYGESEAKLLSFAKSAYGLDSIRARVLLANFKQGRK